MEDVIILVDNELTEIYNAINYCQLFFNPKYCSDGIFSSKDIIEIFPGKEKIVIFDRNVMTLLLQYVTEGTLHNIEQMNEIALIMFWCGLHHINVTSGIALNEYANYNNIKSDVSNELDIFLTVVENYPSMLWKKVLFSTDKTIPKINKILKFNRNIDFDFKSDHQIMHECEMLKLVLINRTKKSQKDKLIDYLNWYFDNLLISSYTLNYIILLFGNYKKIKMPQNSNSTNYDKIIKGCENQAWDLSYLSNWSSFYWDEKDKNSIHFFATMDELMKMIIITTHLGYSINNIVNDLFSKSDSKEVNLIIDDRIKNRKKPKVDKKRLSNLLNELKKELSNLLEQE